MRLLVDEDTASATLITRLLAAGHEVIQLPHGTLDEVVFNEAQRLSLPILTANVGRKGRRDPAGFYQLAIELCGLIQESGICHIDQRSRRLDDANSP